MIYEVNITLVTSQVMHCEVKHKGTGMNFNITMVYGFNDQAQRKELWKDLNCVQATIQGAWQVMGDFICVANWNERIGSRVSYSEIRDFRQCIRACDLHDLKSSGAYYSGQINTLITVKYIAELVGYW